MTYIGICQMVACPELGMDIDVGHCSGCEWNRCIRETEVDCAYEKEK
jgi:hypothetical protein